MKTADKNNRSESVHLLLTGEQPGLAEDINFPATTPLKMVMLDGDKWFTRNDFEKNDFVYRGKFLEARPRETDDEIVWTFGHVYTTGRNASCSNLGKSYVTFDQASLPKHLKNFPTDPSKLTPLQYFILYGLSLCQPPKKSFPNPTPTQRKNAGPVMDWLITTTESGILRMHTPTHLAEWTIVSLGS